MRKNKYVMHRLDVPKRVSLPNGRTFVARYKRVPRSELPSNIDICNTIIDKEQCQGEGEIGEEEDKEVKDCFIK